MGDCWPDRNLKWGLQDTRVWGGQAAVPSHPEVLDPVLSSPSQPYASILASIGPRALLLSDSSPDLCSSALASLLKQPAVPPAPQHCLSWAGLTQAHRSMAVAIGSFSVPKWVLSRATQGPGHWSCWGHSAHHQLRLAGHADLQLSLGSDLQRPPSAC